MIKIKVYKSGVIFILVCLFAFIILVFLNGCAGITTPPSADAVEVNDSLSNVAKYIEVARSEGAAEYSPQKLSLAEELLKKAEEALKKRKTQEAGDLAFIAEVEAKIATVLTQEAKSRHRTEEIKESLRKFMYDTRVDEATAAKARQAIAEYKMLEAQKGAENSKTQAGREIDRSKVELAIAKAELMLDLAGQAKAAEYANQTYTNAKSAIQKARSALNADKLQEATTAAEEAAKYASNASIEARAKIESELAETLRLRDKATAAIAKAELSFQLAKESPSGQYAQDMLEKSEKSLKEADSAMKAKEYERAGSLAEQARVSSSNAMAVAEARRREAQAKEDQEDIRANALDVIAKVERFMSEANNAGAEQLASEAYSQARKTLDQAKQAMQEEKYEEALSLAQEGITYSAAAMAMAQAKAERDRKITEIEKSITEEAVKIPDTAVRKIQNGVVISMSGELFAQGGIQLKKEAQSRMKMLADILKKYPNCKVIIEGHTDDTGNEESNLKISTNRAHNFLRYLVEQEGITLGMLSSVGYGQTQPIASNATEDGRKQNRRIDVVILSALISP